jgi:Tol biopolymer transport system component
LFFLPDGKVISFSGAGGSSGDPAQPTSQVPQPPTRAALAHPVGGPWELYTVRVDGSDFRQITNLGQQFEEMSHAWSPDGTRIVFIALGALNLISADGSTMRRLSDNTPYGEISWSPTATGPQ